LVSAGLDAIANEDSGEARDRRYDVLTIDAAWRPGAEQISDKFFSSTGKEGAQGRMD
jgi:hypothetical protein